MSKNKSTKSIQFLKVLSASAFILGLSVFIYAPTNYLYWLLGGALTIGSLISIRQLRITIATAVDKSIKTEVSNVQQEKISRSNVFGTVQGNVYVGKPSEEPKQISKSDAAQKSVNRLHSLKSGVSKVKPVEYEETKQKPPSKMETGKPACQPGPYKLRSGSYQEILLEVQKGDVLKGHLIEDHGYDFYWWLADNRNFVRYVNDDDDFYPIDGGEGFAAYEVNRRIPRDGRWYIILDASGKSATRNISVNLDCYKETL